jgi:hypothetical protein
VSQPGLRVFVNERLVVVPPGSAAREAVACLDADLASAVAEGRALLTDGRGLPLSPEDPLRSGAILRVARSSRSAVAGADAPS